MNSDKIRRRVRRILRLTPSYCDLDYSDIDRLVQSVLHDNREKTRKSCQKKYSEHLDRSLLAVLALGTMSNCLAEFEKGEGLIGPLPNDWISPSTIPNPNMIVHLLIRQLTNHSLAVVDLVEQGLTNSAQILFRSVLETTWLTLCVASNKNKMIMYAKSRKEENEKKIWRQHFHLNSILTTLGEFEERQGKPVEMIKALHASRRELSAFYSNAVHSSMLNVLVFSQDGEVVKGKMATKANLYGASGLRQRILLEHLNNTIYEFLHYMLIIIFKENGYVPKREGVSWNLAQTFVTSFLASFLPEKKIDQRAADQLHSLFKPRDLLR